MISAFNVITRTLKKEPSTSARTYCMTCELPILKRNFQKMTEKNVLKGKSIILETSLCLHSNKTNKLTKQNPK